MPGAAGRAPHYTAPLLTRGSGSIKFAPFLGKAGIAVIIRGRGFPKRKFIIGHDVPFQNNFLTLLQYTATLRSTGACAVGLSAVLEWYKPTIAG